MVIDMPEYVIFRGQVFFRCYEDEFDARPSPSEKEVPTILRKKSKKDSTMMYAKIAGEPIRLYEVSPTGGDR